MKGPGHLATGLALALSCGLLGAAEDPKADGARHDKDLEGSWVVVSTLRDGEPGERQVGDRFTFQDGQITIKTDEPDAREQVATYTVDPSQNPRWIDVRPRPRESSDPADREPPVIQGIYKIEAGMLTICLGSRDAKRPTAFASEPGSRTILAVLKRPE